MVCKFGNAEMRIVIVFNSINGYEFEYILILCYTKYLVLFALFLRLK